MDDCILRISKAHLDPETVAITRLIAIIIVLFHHLSQIFSSNQNINTYPSLAHYRNAASHRATYHRSLLKVRNIFAKALEAITTNLDEEPSTQQPPNHQQRRNPCRQKINGVVPVRTAFGATLSSKTPKKLKTKQLKEGKISEEVRQMCLNCTGIPMKTHPAKYQRCSICDKKHHGIAQDVKDSFVWTEQTKKTKSCNYTLTVFAEMISHSKRFAFMSAMKRNG